MKTTEADLENFFTVVMPLLDERQRRVVAGSAAKMFGRGGVSAVARAARISRNTVTAGSHNLEKDSIDESTDSDRLRSAGAGRKKKTAVIPGLAAALERLIEASTFDDEPSPLIWTMSTAQDFTRGLQLEGFHVGATLVGQLLREMGFQLRASGGNRSNHDDVVSQFNYLNDTAKVFIDDDQPVISLATRKLDGGTSREGDRVGRKAFSPMIDTSFENGVGGAWSASNADPHAAVSAIGTMGKWWMTSGVARYGKATRVLICVDAGLTNDAAWIPWQLELAKFSASTGLELTTMQIPPVTYRWSSVEEQLFDFSTSRLQASGSESPLLTSEATLATTLTVVLPRTTSERRGTISRDQEGFVDSVPLLLTVDEDHLPLVRHGIHGNWNYTVYPSTTQLEGFDNEMDARDFRIPKNRKRPNSAAKASRLVLRPEPPRRKKVMRVAEIIAHDIARDISTRKLHPGTKLLTEAESVEHFGVSRSSLREALRMLELLGVISIKSGPRGGPIVNQITSADFGSTSTFYYHIVGITIRELLEARAGLEPVLVRIAAERQDPSHARRLEGMINGIEHEYYGHPAWVAPRNHIGDVHGALILTGNPILDLISRSLQEVWLDRLRYVDLPADMRAHLSVDHREITRAIIDGHGELAEKLMQAHALFTLHSVESRFPDLADEVVDWV